MTSNPPMPLATYTPAASLSSGEIFRPDMRTAKSVAARASWMNRPIFLSSFFSTHFCGSKFFTSSRDAARESRGVKVCDRSDAAAAPGDISPCFVGSNAASTDKSDTGNHYTAAQNGFSCGKEMRPELFLAVFIDVGDSVFHRCYFFCIFIRNLDAERFFKRHHKLYDIERIRAQIVHERCGWCYFRFVHSELLHNNLFYSFI